MAVSAQQKFHPLRLMIIAAGLMLAAITTLVAGSSTALAQTLQPLPGWNASADTEESTLPARSIWEMTEDEYAAWLGIDKLVETAAAEDQQSARLASAAHKTRVLAADHQLFLPRTRFEPQLSTRLGYGVAEPGSLENFPAATQLNAGWYQNWVVSAQPPQPNQIDFVQTVRLHQDLTCPIGTDFDRTRCPYVVPYSYSVRPGLGTISQIAQARPGSLWLIGNEMDRIDWGNPFAEGGPIVGHQDEMLPEVYAQAYHDLYYHIKNADPTAKIAIGGIIQPTPIRMQYLTQVWDAYGNTYKSTMPVDVWNMHNFMIREGPNVAGEWGAGIPPGVNAQQGLYVGQRDANGDRTYHIDMAIFDQQVRVFRQWMKDRGQQNKPLIVSEYGVLFPNDAIFLNRALYYDAQNNFAYDVPEPIVNFMLDTFDYFMTESDCTIGYPADDCRLVQAWNWFSLNSYGGFNTHGRLVENSGNNLTPAGNAFADFARRNIMPLSVPYLPFE